RLGGVERFLKPPSKSYTHGGQSPFVLALAARPNLQRPAESAVVVVSEDEVQRRCLFKIEWVARSERNVLFVAHSEGVVTTLCRGGSRSASPAGHSARQGFPPQATWRGDQSHGPSGACGVRGRDNVVLAQCGDETPREHAQVS
ncbi:MAG: hypothetical protein ACKO3P_24410, partial [Planctomycetaceae bacterium]